MTSAEVTTQQLQNGEKFKIAVLLATYNPENYLIEQIASIRAQTGVEVTIYWGDDGSDPELIPWIRETISILPFVEFTHQNLGFVKNFFHLMEKAEGFDYYAFCDQDDVWAPAKLHKHISELKKYKGTPACTHSNSLLLYPDGTKSKMIVCQHHQLKTLLVENCCQGATMTFNNEARLFALEGDTSNIYSHDWWMAQVLSIVGEIIFIDGVDTFYRQHENNVIGYNIKGERIKRLFLRKNEILTRQSLELIKSHRRYFNSDEEVTSKKYMRSVSQNKLLRLIGNVLDERRNLSIYADVARRIVRVFKIA